MELSTEGICMDVNMLNRLLLLINYNYAKVVKINIGTYLTEKGKCHGSVIQWIQNKSMLWEIIE